MDEAKGQGCRREWRWLAVIIVVAVGLRLGAALYLGDDVEPEPGIFDQISYNGLAQRLLTGHGFSFGQEWWPATAAGAPTAHWSFLYTLYLAGVYAVVGVHPLAARILQAVVVGVLLPWLIFRLGRRAFGSVAGLAAAAVSAVYVYFFYYGGSLMTEALYTVGILWVLDLAGKIREMESVKRKAGRWVLLGVAMGLTVLLRQAFLPMVALVAGWLWWSTPGRRAQTARGLLLALAVTALLITPWTVRNYRAFHRLVLLNTNAGYAFFWANHPVHGTSFISLFPPGLSYQGLIPVDLRSLDEAALEQALMRRGVGFVLDDPARYLLLSLSRFKDQFKFWPSPDSGLLSNMSRTGSFGLFLPFMLAGVVLAIRGWQMADGRFPPGWSDGREAGQMAAERGRWRGLIDWTRTEPALWLAVVTAYNAMHLLSWASARYRLPTDAILVLFAGLALARLASAIRDRLRRKSTS